LIQTRRAMAGWRVPAMILLLAAILAAGVGVAIFTGWSFAVLLALAMFVGLGLPALRARMELRLAVFFSLWAIADFIKKVTFLADDQAAWSQYLVFLLPYLYFALAIALPWLFNRVWRGWREVTGFQLLVMIFVGLALVNTWASAQAGLIGKAAASGLLIAPWLMAGVASDHPDAIRPVAYALLVCGILSGLYALVQFVHGPTVLELSWAGETGRMSIGASHLLDVLEGRSYAFLWRITGFQADEFTFAYFMLTAFACAWWLRSERFVSRPVFLTSAALFAGTIGLSLVRTGWAAFVAFVLFYVLARRRSFLLKPAVIVLLTVAAFFAGDIASTVLNRIGDMAASSSNLLLRRAMTFGTLEAREGASGVAVAVVRGHWLSGLGFAASQWITTKFGGFPLLQGNFAAHNAIVELLWYVGLLGVVLFYALLYAAQSGAWKSWKQGRLPINHLALMTAFVVAMYLTGLSTAGVFLSFPFFFYLGLLGAKRYRDDNGSGPRNLPTEWRDNDGTGSA
jgi:hypothetical protein